MSIYLAVEVYKVSSNEAQNIKPQSVFLPLWVSVNWPWQRKYSVDSLRYFDEDLYEEMQKTPNYAQTLQDEGVRTQVLDCLCRSPLVREKFAVPMALEEQKDSFELWIEPTHPTVHGLEFTIGKDEGNLNIGCNWSISPIRWGSALSSVSSQVSSIRDSMYTGDESKITEAGSGRVHEVGKRRRKSSSAAETYRLMFSGSFYVSSMQEEVTGSAKYRGVLDPNHFGLHRVQIRSLDLKVTEQGSVVLYKLK